MARPRNPVGVFGEISSERFGVGRFRARVRYRDTNGRGRRALGPQGMYAHPYQGWVCQRASAQRSAPGAGGTTMPGAAPPGPNSVRRYGQRVTNESHFRLAPPKPHQAYLKPCQP